LAGFPIYYLHIVFYYQGEGHFLLGEVDFHWNIFPIVSV
jgi:hypothetical protein